MSIRRSWLAASARDRVLGVLDPGTLKEACPPSARCASPHLAALDLPQAFDDGIVTGSGRVAGQAVLIAAQEGRFNGGSVGEVHGAKLVGLLQAAVAIKPRAVLLLIDSGGVRLHEANAGILAISEIARALLAVRAAGIPVIALLGGSCGAFGGMGIVTRLCHCVVMSEEGRLGLSGPEVIETVKGREEFDSRDRALVWRVTGGKTRRAQGEADRLVENDIAAFRAVVLELLATLPPEGLPALSAEALQQGQAVLVAQRKAFALARDGREILARRVALPEAEWALASAAAFEHALRGAPGQDPLGEGPDLPPEIPLTGLDGDDQAFADRLFGRSGHRLQSAAHFLLGEGDSRAGTLWVVGTRDRAPIDGQLALQMAAAILAAVAADRAAGRCRPILLISETQGQLLSRHEELLGLHGVLAHLALCVDLARRAGHRLITLVRNEAVSGGFLAFGMLGDRICALPGAQVRVMDLRAMARVTHIPLERLEALADHSPVFAPGADNFFALGGVHALWREDDDWQAALATALAAASDADQRAELGAARGGRRLAQAISGRVRARLTVG